jgi:ATP-dependent protease Clp ATPase subunit
MFTRPGPNPARRRITTGRAAARSAALHPGIQSQTPRNAGTIWTAFVIQQADAKKVLAVAICDHYNHARQCIATPTLREREYSKQNVILLGPTGVGKTYLIRCISRLIGVPFVKSDATKFSETGYVGHDVEDLGARPGQGGQMATWSSRNTASFTLTKLTRSPLPATTGGT